MPTDFQALSFTSPQTALNHTQSRYIPHTPGCMQSKRLLRLRFQRAILKNRKNNEKACDRNLTQALTMCYYDTARITYADRVFQSASDNGLNLYASGKPTSFYDG